MPLTGLIALGVFSVWCGLCLYLCLCIWVSCLYLCICLCFCVWLFCLSVLSGLIQMLHSVSVSGNYFLCLGVLSGLDAPLWASVCVSVSVCFFSLVQMLHSVSVSGLYLCVWLSCLVRMLHSGPWQNGSKPQLDFLPDTRYLLQIEIPLLQIPRSIHFFRLPKYPKNVLHITYYPTKCFTDNPSSLQNISWRKGAR